MRDDAVSELLGYTLVVAIVCIAVMALMSASMGAVAYYGSSVEKMSSDSGIGGLADIAIEVSSSNDTYYSIYGLYAPPSYTFISRDSADDVRSLSIYDDGTLLTTARTGSLGLYSEFRDTVFAGGSTFSNDSGSISVLSGPRIYVTSSQDGKRSLYLDLTSVRSATWASPEGCNTNVAIRSVSTFVQDFPVKDGHKVKIVFRGLPGWGEALERQGFILNGDSAFSTGISSVHVTVCTIEVSQYEG
jgi:hypothetical protein